jgi:hypothetical protein
MAKTPTTAEDQFRASLFARVFSELVGFSPSAIIRMLSAASEIRYGDKDCDVFRFELQKSVGSRFSLKSFRRKA